MSLAITLGHIRDGFILTTLQFWRHHWILGQDVLEQSGNSGKPWHSSGGKITVLVLALSLSTNAALFFRATRHVSEVCSTLAELSN